MSVCDSCLSSVISLVFGNLCCGFVVYRRGCCERRSVRDSRESLGLDAIGIPLDLIPARQFYRLTSHPTSATKMSSLTKVRRGAFIVFEGLDRSGKSSQVQRLVDNLNSEGVKAVACRFPGT